MKPTRINLTRQPLTESGQEADRAGNSRPLTVVSRLNLGRYSTLAKLSEAMISHTVVWFPRSHSETDIPRVIFSNASFLETFRTLISFSLGSITVKREG
jgi:hypothetical protein